MALLAAACSSVEPTAYDEAADFSTEGDTGDDIGETGGDWGGRILWVTEEEGDLLVHATVGSAVAADFGDGVHYEIRFDVDAEAVYVAVIDERGAMRELVRLAERGAVTWPSAQAPLQYCYPHPLIPEPVNSCMQQPCAWDERGWPSAGQEWPDCLELVSEESSGTVRVTGAVGGHRFGWRIDRVGTIEALFEVELPAGSAERLARAVRIAADVSSLVGELEQLDVGCPGCLLLGSWLIDRAHACGEFGGEACSEAFYGYAYWKHDCEGACG